MHWHDGWDAPTGSRAQHDSLLFNGFTDGVLSLLKPEY